MRYIVESNIHVTIRVDDVITVVNPERLTNDEIIALFNVGFSVIREKLGPLSQYTMMNDKIMSERSVTSNSEASHLVNCSFYLEKEYELPEEINTFKSVELHLTNKIREDVKKLETDKRFEWVYPAIKNVRFYCNKPHVKIEEETENE